MSAHSTWTVQDWAAAPCHKFCDAELITPEEAAAIVAAAEALDAWRIRGAYEGNLTCDIDAFQLVEAGVPAERCLPLLSTMFSIGRDALRLTDLRVVRYTAATGIAGLPLHSDGSALSFVCALNECGGGGGGTYVRTLQRVISPSPGCALLFCGRWVHAGVPIQSGVRYVLTGFLELDGEASASGTFSRSRNALLAIERVVESERQATVARRLCPKRGHWLRREFVHQFGSAEEEAVRRCSRCEADVPIHGVRHVCCGGNELCGCGTAWCDDCLATDAAAEEQVIVGAAAATASSRLLLPFPHHRARGEACTHTRSRSCRL